MRERERERERDDGLEHKLAEGCYINNFLNPCRDSIFRPLRLCFFNGWFLAKRPLALADCPLTAADDWPFCCGYLFIYNIPNTYTFPPILRNDLLRCSLVYTARTSSLGIPNDGSVKGQYATLLLSLFFKMSSCGHFLPVLFHLPLRLYLTKNALGQQQQKRNNLNPS